MALRILFLSNLFPDRTEPVRGLDNATLLESLAGLPGTETRVLSPRPDLKRWLPGRETPANWTPLDRDRPHAPLFVPVRYVPGMGSRWNDRLMLADLRKSLDALRLAFRPDVILASWLFPDGCAASLWCRSAGIPLVLITQGTDTHGYLRQPTRRRKILQAAALSRAVICRSRDLARRLEEAGVAPEKLHTIYNGVDASVFFRGDRGEARRRLGLDREEPVFLFVGNLLPVKDPDFLLEAFSGWCRQRKASHKPEGRLVLIGEGPLRGRLQSRVAALGLSHRVHLAGRKGPAEISEWMRAADALCLSSRNEGFPNVILEAIASGLPVISTRVGGIAEKVGTDSPGWLVAPSDRAEYEAALESAASREIRRSIPNLGPSVGSWPEVARSYRILLAESAGSRH